MEKEKNNATVSTLHFARSVARRFLELSDRLADICAYLSGILIMVSIVIVNSEVTTRYVFLLPTAWGIPLAEYTLCYLALLPFAWILKSEGHVRVDFVTGRLSQGKRAVLNKIISFVSMLLWTALFVVGSILTWQSFWRGEYLSGEFAAPQWLLTLPVCVTSFLMACQFARRWRTPAGEFVSQ